MSSDMGTYMWTIRESGVHCMCEDPYFTGNIVHSEGRALRSTDGGQTFQAVIAGNVTQSGYAEGVQQAATFRRISSCLHLNRTSLLVVDSGNHCLRLVNRRSRQTSKFVGN